jgi:hypothetical protein
MLALNFLEKRVAACSEWRKVVVVLVKIRIVVHHSYSPLYAYIEALPSLPLPDRCAILGTSDLSNGNLLHVAPSHCAILRSSHVIVIAKNSFSALRRDFHHGPLFTRRLVLKNKNHPPTLQTRHHELILGSSGVDSTRRSYDRSTFSRGALSSSCRRSVADVRA